MGKAHQGTGVGLRGLGKWSERFEEVGKVGRNECPILRRARPQI